MNRKPWLAGLLSLLTPGLGQLYNGEARKALTFFLLLPLLGMVMILAFLHFPMWPVNLVVPPAVQLGVWAYTVADAVRTARRLGSDFRPVPFNRWYVYALVFVAFALVITPTWAALGKRYVARSFVAQASNMDPAILSGDYVIADTWGGAVRRGDIVFFRWPDDDSLVVIGRLVGFPGDTIEMRNRVLHVQGQQIAEPRVRHNDGEDSSNPLMLWQQQHLKAAGTDTEYRPTMNNWGPLVIPEDMHFVLGDNRANSLDSRFRGFVPASRIGGRFHMIYFSREPVAGKIRWSRLGKVVG